MWTGIQLIIVVYLFVVELFTRRSLNEQLAMMTKRVKADTCHRGVRRSPSYKDVSARDPSILSANSKSFETLQICVYAILIQVVLYLNI